MATRSRNSSGRFAIPPRTSRPARTCRPAAAAPHLVGGWPYPVQTHIPIFEDIHREWEHTPYAIAEADMRLLLQLECDGSVVPASLSSTARFTMTEGWSWGDAGSIYFVASSSDLARGAFERVCLSRQTY